VTFSRRHRPRRSTPAGEHRPVLLAEVLAALDPRPGEVVVDCTVGWAGHAVELLRRVGPTGHLLGLDLDPRHLAEAGKRLGAVGPPFTLRQANFAGLPAQLAAEGLSGADAVLADLGMSSMQVDDAGRGFSYRRDGPLDMRMDPTRGPTAAELLATIAGADLERALHELGDEPESGRIAAAIVAARRTRTLLRTGDLVEVIISAVRPGGWRLRPARNRWELHPAARTFQALRILVNRELNNLQALLRGLPTGLRPGGRAVVISFHSGEDRLVKFAFREGVRTGGYAWAAPEPVRASAAERLANPRARSAKLRWARGP
jgi:16S rRNA (cytosine1402-N4)-methyltransferase